MRKVLILLVLTASAAAAVYYVRSKSSQSTTTVDSSVSTTSEGRLEVQHVEPAQEIVTLRDDVIAFIKIDLAKTSQLTERINQFAASISGAPLWKRLGVSERLVGDFMNGVTKNAADPEKAPEQARVAIETALAIAREMQTLTLVIAPAAGEVPVQVMLNAGVAGTKLRKFIDDNLKSMPYADIEQQPDGYKLALHNPKASDIPARIQYADNSLQIYFNANGAQEFGGAKTLKDSPKLDLIRSSLLPDQFFQLYVDTNSVLKLLIKAIEIAPGSAGNDGSNQVKALMEQQWKGIKAVSLTAAFHSGFESRQCVDLEGDSWMSQIYNVFAGHKTNKRSTNQFASLIGPDSMAALWMDARGMQQLASAYIDAVQTGYLNALNDMNAQASINKEVMAPLQGVLKSTKEFISAYNPDEIGILVRPSVGLPWPDFLVFYSDEKLSAVQLITQIKQLGDKAAAVPDAPRLELSGQGANSQLKLVGSPVPLPFVIAALGDRGIVLASGPGAVQVARSKLGQIDTFAKNLSVQVGGQRIMALESDYFILLNSRRVFDLIRPYLPMVVARAAATDQSVSIEEVSDMLNRLERQFLSVQSLKMLSPGRYCAESAIEVTAAQ